LDNLVLTRLAFDLSGELPGTILEECRQESGDRFRLIFASAGTRVPLVVSLRPDRPWIGRPALGWSGPRWSPDPIAVTIARRLTGVRVESVSKPPADRVLRIDCGDGRGLVVELADRAGNLVFLGPGGTVEASARAFKRSVDRLAEGAVWSLPPAPSGRIDPFAADVGEIDAALADEAGGLAGVARDAIAAVRREADALGLTPGAALRRRLDAVLQGESEVAIEGPGDPRLAIREGRFAAPTYRIVAWRWPDDGVAFVEASTVATVGLYYEGAESVARLHERLLALAGIVRNEIRRTHDASRRVEEERLRFQDPLQFQRWGEALLAGLRAARREGDTAWVPDPYDPDGATIAIPAPAARSLAGVADDLFKKSRRARRGQEAAALRARSLSDRARRLESILPSDTPAPTEDNAEALESAMRAAGLAVGLKRATRAGRAAERIAAPRLAGVRTLRSADGWTILIGRTGKDNDRLTFKVAAAEDIWLHAADVSGAHVVIRNPEGASRIPEATLREAASAAAWFSDARSAGVVDVHWTRRKYVRRAAGSSSGRVLLKRFETMRVRAAAPTLTD